MTIPAVRITFRFPRFATALTAMLFLAAAPAVNVQAAAAQTTAKPEVPDWALPGSATHKQSPPPADFHRPTTTFNTPIGIFQGQATLEAPCFPEAQAITLQPRPTR